jgi:hypothetical protein
MTYTTVLKCYQADTFAAAVAEMMLDPEIWDRHGFDESYMADVGSFLAIAGGAGLGNNRGYSVESWAWRDHTLTVWYGAETIRAFR